MTDLTLIDATHEPIVRKALEAALVSGVARPSVVFRSHRRQIEALVQADGQWSVTATGGPADHAWDAQALNLTTDAAVALIVATAKGTL